MLNCVYIKTFFVVCVYVFLYLCGGMYVSMSEGIYVWMYLYLYACKSDREEREIRGGQFNCLKNVVVSGHDPIILYLTKRFWPSALLNSCFELRTLSSKMSHPEMTTIFWCSDHAIGKQNFLATILSYNIETCQDYLQEKI